MERSLQTSESSNSKNSSPAAGTQEISGWSARIEWDFFTDATGRKKAYLERVDGKTLIIRASEPIEFRRWLRVILRDRSGSLLLPLVGRVSRREHRLEAIGENDFTLYRYGVELTRDLPRGISLTSPA